MAGFGFNFASFLPQDSTGTMVEKQFSGDKFTLKVAWYYPGPNTGNPVFYGAD
jgi:hypothetical protein